MEALERENAARVARGGPPRELHEAWVKRPRLLEHEESLWHEFLLFGRFCGGDPRPPDALAWFEMRGVAKAEQYWLAEVFGALAEVVRKPEAPDE